MSSTISVRKEAAALVADSGEVFYALFEETYDSNVYPRTPCWSTVFFGTGPACTQDAVRWAGATEGGILKEKSGHTTPTRYLKHWRDALATPGTLRLESVTLEFGSRRDQIGSDRRQEVETILAAHGLRIENETCVLTLGKHAHVLQAVCRVPGLRPSRWIDHYDRSPDYVAGTAYAPPKQPAPPATFSVFHIEEGASTERNYWVELADGSLHGMGWAYATIDALINSHAANAERDYPGSAEHMMRTIRKKIEESTPLPQELPVIARFDFSNQYCWGNQLFEKLARKLDRQGDVLLTTVCEIIERDAIYEFKSIPVDQLFICSPRNLKPTAAPAQPRQGDLPIEHPAPPSSPPVRGVEIAPAPTPKRTPFKRPIGARL